MVGYLGIAMFAMGTAFQFVRKTGKIIPAAHTFTISRKNWKIFIFPKARRRKKALVRGILCIG